MKEKLKISNKLIGNTKKTLERNITNSYGINSNRNILTNNNKGPITLHILINNKTSNKYINKYYSTNNSKNKKPLRSKTLAKNQIDYFPISKNNQTKQINLFSSMNNIINKIQNMNVNEINTSYSNNRNNKSISKIKNCNLFNSVSARNFKKERPKTSYINENIKTKECSKDLGSFNTKESTFNNGKNVCFKNIELFKKYENLKKRANNILNNYVNLINTLNDEVKKHKDNKNELIF